MISTKVNADRYFPLLDFQKRFYLKQLNTSEFLAMSCVDNSKFCLCELSKIELRKMVYSNLKIYFNNHIV